MHPCALRAPALLRMGRSLHAIIMAGHFAIAGGSPTISEGPRALPMVADAFRARRRLRGACVHRTLAAPLFHRASPMFPASAIDPWRLLGDVPIIIELPSMPSTISGTPGDARPPLDALSFLYRHLPLAPPAHLGTAAATAHPRRASGTAIGDVLLSSMMPRTSSAIAAAAAGSSPSSPPGLPLPRLPSPTSDRWGASLRRSMVVDGTIVGTVFAPSSSPVVSVVLAGRESPASRSSYAVARRLGLSPPRRLYPPDTPHRHGLPSFLPSPFDRLSSVSMSSIIASVIFDHH